MAAAPGPRLAPRIIWPDGSVMNDSTPLIRRLEGEHKDRAALPSDPALLWLCDLLEDWADEWVTKAMYHYRWKFDPEWASSFIGWQSQGPAGPDEQAQKVKDFVRNRQVSRMGVVGSNSITGPVIEAGYERVVKLLEAHLEAGYPFLLGSRPSAADFAVLGQLHPMISLDAETSRQTRSSVADREQILQ